jgi:hypothetical protein
MTTYQHEAWEANEMELDAIDAAADVAPEDDLDWQAFLDEQAELERDAMFDDPAYIAYIEQTYGYHEDVA